MYLLGNILAVHLVEDVLERRNVCLLYTSGFNQNQEQGNVQPYQKTITLFRRGGGYRATAILFDLSLIHIYLRREERTGWTSKGQLTGSVADFNKVMEAIRYL